MPSDRLGGPAGVAALVAVGATAALVGVCAGWVSRAVWRVGPADLPTIAIPWGLLLSLAGSVSLIALVRPLRRAAPLVAALCWFAGVVVLTVRGDTIVAGDARGISFLIVVSIAVLLSATVTGARP
jgi:hypothetical protein